VKKNTLQTEILFNLSYSWQSRKRNPTCALRNWRKYICQGMRHSALPLRHGSLPARYHAKWGKNDGRRNGFLTATSTQKTHVDAAIKKSLLWLNDKAP